MKKQEQLPINTNMDYHMVREGLRYPKAEKLPKEVYQKSPEQRKEIKQLKKSATFENKVMLSSKF